MDESPSFTTEELAHFLRNYHQLGVVAMDESPYFTTEELAHFLRIPQETIRGWRHRSKGPRSLKVPGGRRVLYAKADVQSWLATAQESA